MNDVNNKKINHNSYDSFSPVQDQQLYSFKFHKGKVLWRACNISLVIIISYKIVFDWALNKKIIMFLISEIVFGILLIAAIFMLLDTLFAKKIVLYRTKIVKVWSFGLRREVEFLNSKFGIGNTWFCKIKKFWPYWAKTFFAPFVGVVYDENLVSNKDVRKMNQLLSKISQRDIGLFESEGIFSINSFTLNCFLKEREDHE